MKLVYIFSIILLLLSCNKKADKQTEIIENQNESVQSTNAVTDLKIYNFLELEPLLHQKTDGVIIINFWATWCAPCIKELPHFEEVFKNYKAKNVKLLLVSLDFPHQYDSKLKPFIEKHKLKGDVVALDDTDMNSWIPKVSETWSGSIPATLIYSANKRKFYEQSFTYNELETELQTFLKK